MLAQYHRYDWPIFKRYAWPGITDIYKIAVEDATKLLYRVSAFVKMVDLLCTEKLEAMS